MATLSYKTVRPTPALTDLASAGTTSSDPTDLQTCMLSLMHQNVAIPPMAFVDPMSPGTYSLPGCVIASPSYTGSPASPEVRVDYVYNWTRDAAIVTSELLSSGPALLLAADVTALMMNYIMFAKACQQNDQNNYVKNRSRYTVDAHPTDWIDPQSDGPALRILTILQILQQSPTFLDAPTAAIARSVIDQDLTYLLTWNNINYSNPTMNHWENCQGFSLFARAVQLKCLLAVAANTVGVVVPAETDRTITDLTESLEDHRDMANQRYTSMLGRQPINPAAYLPAPYEPCIDPIMAAIHGSGINFTDTLLLSTASQVRGQWTPPSPSAYPINGADSSNGLGPLIGRFNGDTYDGDLDTLAAGHPWAVCTCNFAQLYYSLALTIRQGAPVPSDGLTTNFWGQIGLQDPASLSKASAIAALRTAGDVMLNAVIYHSDNFHLSEQFDATSGWEKSVSDLTWSYAAFLSAVRVRNS